MDNNVQKIDLYQPLMHIQKGAVPVVIRVGTTPNVDSMMSGPQTGTTKIEHYVLLSVLPTELQERVRTAVQALIAGQ